MLSLKTLDHEVLSHYSLGMIQRKSCAILMLSQYETVICYPFYFDMTFPSEPGNNVGLDLISLVFSNLRISNFLGVVTF